ncbi:Unknown protein [Striga hermonthica]|uniref:Uncharacterized protein n=1 Tax=Striga hermonthica TaxID=68872 RepID=A0A9N7N8B1_STRHE|nr:Unknown protein [Striga hermonthica]
MDKPTGHKGLRSRFHTSFSKKTKHASSSHYGPDEEEEEMVTKPTRKAQTLFGLFERRPKKNKAKAKPGFSRYTESIKEVGTMDMRAKMPVVFGDQVCFY